MQLRPGRFWISGSPLAVTPWNDSRLPCGGGLSMTQPGYHSASVPPSSPAQKRARLHGSELSQHDLAFPADSAVLVIVHESARAQDDWRRIQRRRSRISASRSIAGSSLP